MKKTLSILLCAALLCTLCACAGTQGETAADAPPQENIQLPTEPGFALTAEYGRLYWAPLDGSGTQLLADRYTSCSEHREGRLLAAYNDGAVERIDLAAGTREELIPPGGELISRIWGFDGGFLGQTFSLREGPKMHCYADESESWELLMPERWMQQVCVLGDVVFWKDYVDKEAYLSALELGSGQELWRRRCDGSLELYRCGDTLLGFLRGDGILCRVAPETGELQQLALPLEKSDREFLYAWGDAFLVRTGYAEGSRLYLLRDGSRTELNLDDPENTALEDVSGAKVLLRERVLQQSEAFEDSRYLRERRFLLDMGSGEVSDFPVQGRYGALFAGGDFPVMDSSTARKPVTEEIYRFFCEHSGAGGSVPLCSTTHKAWLNIADGVADVALLAAPTAEEQEYLRSRGVEVEMKLYGGDGLVFIGNRECGVEDLSLEQLRAIYRGEITNWAQLGGADHAIRVLYRDDQSGSQRLFERLLWADGEAPDLEALGFERLDDMSTIVSQCLDDPYAIGYSIMTYLSDVYRSEDLLAFSLEGYAATPGNVAAQSYPLSTQGYVVMRADEPEDSPARRLFDWFGSPLCDYLLTFYGITPLHGESVSPD